MGLTQALTAGNHGGLALVVAGIFAVSGVSVIPYVATHQGQAPQATLATSVVATTPSPTPSPAIKDDATGSVAASSTQLSANVVPAPEQSTVPAPQQRVVAAPRQQVVPAPRQRVVPAPRSKVRRAMSASLPVSLAIPAINVKSSGMLHLGQTVQGSLQVPPPGPDYNKVAWYRNSPTPGSLGPAVLVGHVDSAAYGPSVFYRLAALKRGDLVWVTRADKSVAVFRVDDVRQFRKSDFPTNLVYGNTDHAALRIITCGGAFDRDVGHYVDNTVVLASLI
jgi:hypothetical protein